MKRRAYSLIELMVVIGLITVISIISLPSFMSINENYALNNASTTIRDMIIRAKTNSLAPESSVSGKTQFYQVAFSSFTKEANNGTYSSVLAGTLSTTTVVKLQRGNAQCSASNIPVIDAALTDVETFNLPGKVYISSFFPYKINDGVQPEIVNAAIRFSMGRLGFNCGDSVKPTIDSTQTDLSQSTDPFTLNTGGTNNIVVSSMYVQLTSSKSNKIKYININRFSGNVSILNKADNVAFSGNPVTDNVPPSWLWNAEKTTTAGSVSIIGNGGICPTSGYITLNLTFKRAEDAYVTGTFVPTAPVYYNVYWRISSSFISAPSYNPSDYSLMRFGLVGDSDLVNVETTNNSNLYIPAGSMTFSRYVNFLVEAYDAKGQLVSSSEVYPATGTKMIDGGRRLVTYALNCNLTGGGSVVPQRH